MVRKVWSFGRALLIASLTVILTLPLQPSWAASDTGPAEGPIGQDEVLFEDALVMGPSGLLDGLVEEHDIEIIDTYDTFIHIQAPTGTMQILQALGYDLRPLDRLHTICFDVVTFDTRAGEPQIPASLRDDRSDIYIVQLRGPAKEEWKSELASYGTILDIVQFYSYIMHLTPVQAGQVSALDFVTWVGKYHPYYKVRTGFDEAAAAQGDTELVKAEAVFFKHDGEAYERGLGAIASLGGTIIERDDDSNWWYGARIEFPLAKLFAIARLDGLALIEPYGDPQSRLDRVRWVVQSYDADNESTPIWDNGIHGEGIVVGGADTGIDLSHVAFRNSTGDVGTVGLDNRKIVQYNTTVDDWDDSSGHGSHTMGAIAGNNVSSMTGYSKYDGVAYAAKIAFYDIVLPDGTYDPPIMTAILQDAYNFGAESHSDSWGDDTTAYTTRSQRIDQFQWDHYEFLTFVAPGNSGIVWEPATAKNCVSVGNAYNSETQDIADSSAVGPANGNMINPHIVVPGMSIISPQADMFRNNTNWGYVPLSGTSMATPVAAGITALIEQYFKDGFYPTGTKVSANGFTPSGPLKKAALLNSGWDQFGGKKGADSIGHIPNSQQGWGKVKLDDVLYFDGDSKGLWIYDGYNNTAGAGLKTGEKASYLVHANASQSLEITLVWNDFPGQGLINDIDLTVLDPQGNVYKGNNYQNGHSVPDGQADSANPTESVQIDAPIEGFYLINVTAVNIQSQVYQRFALVATGSIHDANQGGVNFNKAIFGINDKVGVRLVDADLANLGWIDVEVSSLKETAPESVRLAETGIKGMFEGEISLSLGPVKSDGTLQVNEMDTLLVQYLEDHPSGTRVATAQVDARPPKITNVRVSDITTVSVTISWETDEPSDTNVTYGPSKALGLTNRTAALVTEHVLVLKGLWQSTLYYFDVASSDGVVNQRIDDNSGKFYTFRTASFIIKSMPGYSGWVREPEPFNHFTDGVMYSGYFVDLERYAVTYFNISQVPDNAEFVAATLRIYGRSRAALAPTGGTWVPELLDQDANHLFNGSTVKPTFSDISAANVDATLAPKANADLIEDQWTTFEISSSELTHLADRLGSDGVAFSIVGPASGPNNMFSWDTGNTAGGNSLGPAYAPQLIVTVNLIPLVAPGAPRAIQMDEDTDRVLDLGTIFSDDGPLNYTVTRPPEHLDYNITDAILKLVPGPNWNGEDYITIKATDAVGLYAEHRINITIVPNNDPPTIFSVGGKPAKDGLVLNATQDQTDTFLVQSDDVDIPIEGDLLFYETNLSWAKVVNRNLTISPSNADVGKHHLRLTVKDLGGLSDSVDLVIDVANVDDPPVAVISHPGENFEGFSGTEIEFNGSLSTDPDVLYDDALAFRWSSSLQGDIGTGAVLKRYLLAGKHLITLTVEDKGMSQSMAQVNITIFGDCDADGLYDPVDPDDDDDGMPDYWELAYGLDPCDPTDARTDLDHDGSSNLKEYEANTSPTNSKSHPKETAEEAGSWRDLLLFVLVFVVAGVMVAYFMSRKGGSSEDVNRSKGPGKKARRPRQEEE